MRVCATLRLTPRRFAGKPLVLIKSAIQGDGFYGSTTGGETPTYYPRLADTGNAPLVVWQME